MTDIAAQTTAPRRFETPALGALFILSGAAAPTIAIFLAGTALGGWIFGCISARLVWPLRAFGLVEIGVAATALGHFLVADAYVTLYPTPTHWSAPIRFWKRC
ncbi:MAG: hypothetical protein EA386_13980 [Rhodobacteraceae bacterium]|nr:MAG: hypothetical protein EA386_13980 [Paracoccaceae bacterium]